MRPLLRGSLSVIQPKAGLYRRYRIQKARMFDHCQAYYINLYASYFDPRLKEDLMYMRMALDCMYNVPVYSDGEVFHSPILPGHLFI